MSKIDTLKIEIEKKKRELENLLKEEANSARNQAIKKLSDYTDAQKIKEFDYFYNFALSELNSAENDESETDKQYAWEAIMQLLAKDNQVFWSYYNSLSK